MKILTMAILVTGCSFTPGASQNGAPDSGAAPGDAGMADAHALPDAPPDAPVLPLVTLRETIDDVDATGKSDACQVAAGTHDEAYMRLYPLLADWGVSTGFHLASVTFGTHQAQSAVNIHSQAGIYTGSLTAPTVDTSAIAWFASSSMNVADEVDPTLVTMPLIGEIPAGAVLIVSVSSPDYVTAGSGGIFEIGGAAGGQTRPSYFASQACPGGPLSPPGDTDKRNGDSVGSFILDVTGWAD